MRLYRFVIYVGDAYYRWREREEREKRERRQRGREREKERERETRQTERQTGAETKKNSLWIVRAICYKAESKLVVQRANRYRWRGQFIIGRAILYR